MRAAGIITFAVGLITAAGAGAQGLETRDRNTADPLLRDMVVAQGTTGTFQIDLPPGTYDVSVTMGDALYPQSEMALLVQGSLVESGIATAAGQFYRKTVPVTLTTGSVTVGFSNPSRYWVANALEVKQNGSPVKRFDFGTDSSPVADGYTRATNDSLYEAGAGHGWQVHSVEKLHVIKIPDPRAAGFPTQSDYMIALERFPLYAERGWHPATEAGVPGWFGDPSEGEMGMRSMGNFIFVYALLAGDPAYDPEVSGISRETLLSRARECLQYMCRTHVTGDLNRPTGKKWGDHWQSAWWTVRMAAGARLLWEQLSPAERGAVERVVVHEANRHLPRTVPSGTTSNTRSEENAWDAEVLAWATSMFASHPNAAQWQHKANEFTMNTLSVVQDEQNQSVVDGRTVADWVYTTNIHNDYTIENHGAYHFCYMACPLHSMAWAYHGYVSNGKTPPQALFHHARDVMRVIRATWLSDGRFAYMAGKDWPRYVYGLYFIVPALTMFQDLDNDAEARLFERERFRLFEWESRQSGDGSFFSRRFTGNVMVGRLLEYETDCAANLGLSYLLHQRKAPPAPTEPEEFERSAAQTFTSWNTKMALTRDPEWFASWSWRSLSGKSCVGLVVPNGAADLAEWGGDQFLSQFSISGVPSPGLVRRITWNDQKSLGPAGGFTAIGSLAYNVSGQPVQVERRVACAALAGPHKMVVYEELRALSTVEVSSLSSGRFYLPNDLFNGNSRVLRFPSGQSLTVRGAGSSAASGSFSSLWTNIDDQLGLTRIPVQGQSRLATLILSDQSSRQTPFSSLSYELLDWDPAAGAKSYGAGEVIRRSAILVAAEDSRMTSLTASLDDLALLPGGSSSDPAATIIPGTDGRSWIVAANFETTARNFDYTPPAGSLLSGQTISFAVAGRSVEVREVESKRVGNTASADWQKLN